MTTSKTDRFLLRQGKGHWNKNSLKTHFLPWIKTYLHTTATLALPDATAPDLPTNICRFTVVIFYYTLILCFLQWRPVTSKVIAIFSRIFTKSTVLFLWLLLIKYLQSHPIERPSCFQEAFLYSYQLSIPQNQVNYFLCLDICSFNFSKVSLLISCSIRQASFVAIFSGTPSAINHSLSRRCRS